jgi:hypothetical protein
MKNNPRNRDECSFTMRPSIIFPKVKQEQDEINVIDDVGPLGLQWEKSLFRTMLMGVRNNRRTTRRIRTVYRDSTQRKRRWKQKTMNHKNYVVVFFTDRTADIVVVSLKSMDGNQ